MNVYSTYKKFFPTHWSNRLLFHAVANQYMHTYVSSLLCHSEKRKDRLRTEERKKERERIESPIWDTVAEIIDLSKKTKTFRYQWNSGVLRIVFLMGAGCMRGLHNPFPAPRVENVHWRFGLGPPSLLLREETPWKNVFLKQDCRSRCLLFYNLLDFVGINVYVVVECTCLNFENCSSVICRPLVFLNLSKAQLMCICACMCAYP